MRLEDLGPPPRNPGTWPAWIAIGLMWLVARIPDAVARPVFAALGAFAGVVARRRRHIVTRNLELCLKELDADARAKLRGRIFRSFGIGVYEFVRGWWGSLGPHAEATRIEGLEHIEAARAAGRGVILLSGHFMSFELAGKALCARTPVAAMYRPYANPAYEWAILRGRLRYVVAMFRRTEIRAVVRHLRAGGLVWYAPDQDLRSKDAVFAPFFGIPANTITATSQLARMSGAAVVPFFHRRRPGGIGYEIRLEPALEYFPSGNVADDATRVNALIERMVREAPDEYLWVHRRFKRRPPGLAKLY